MECMKVENYPLYYIDGPLAGKKYEDPNTVTGQRWRDGKGGCYMLTGEVSMVAQVGMVRIVKHVFCESPPIGTVKSWKPHSGESRSIHLGYAAGHWFTVNDCSANYECDRHEEEAAARDYVGVLITTFGRDTSWMEFEPE